MNHKPAKCCEKCQQLDKFGGCKTQYKKCYRWRLWFRQEWEGIRQAARKNNEREGSTK